MTDEQAVRKWLVRTGRYFNTSSAAQALALLDAKDEEIASVLAAQEIRARTILQLRTRAEQAEAALAERDAAMVKIAERCHGGAVDTGSAHAILPLVEPFLPAKPAVDPLVGVLKEVNQIACVSDDEVAGILRAAIERAGGTIEFPDALLAQRSKTNG